MARRHISARWDRVARNDINDNFIELYEGNELIGTIKGQLDDLILNKGESDAEVVQARGDFDLLYQRLDAADIRLTEFALGINGNNINLFYDGNNRLVGYEEKKGSRVVNKAELEYDGSGVLRNVSELKDGKTVRSELIYDNGRLDTVRKSVGL